VSARAVAALPGFGDIDATGLSDEVEKLERELGPAMSRRSALSHLGSLWPPEFQPFAPVIGQRRAAPDRNGKAAFSSRVLDPLGLGRPIAEGRWPRPFVRSAPRSPSGRAG
jgi:hypothetical protein